MLKHVDIGRAPALDASALLRLLRPEQWAKNVFVCAGVIFGGHGHDPKLLLMVASAFAAFSLMGSSVYVYNDYLDRESDMKHPGKCNRPLVSGAVTTAQGFTAAALCLVLSILAAYFADLRVLGMVLAYLLVNVAYSLRLKHQPIIDVFCISSGFMLRILAGTWGVHVPPSGWLILTGMFITLFLGFGKRRAEYREECRDDRRPVLASYTREMLDTFLSITATGTVLSYGLYTLDPRTIALHHTDKLIATLPFVLFGLFRYLYLLHTRDRGENPSVDVFVDRPILLCGFSFTVSVLWLLNS